MIWTIIGFFILLALLGILFGIVWLIDNGYEVVIFIPVIIFGSWLFGIMAKSMFTT